MFLTGLTVSQFMTEKLTPGYLGAERKTMMAEGLMKIPGLYYLTKSWYQRNSLVSMSLIQYKCLMNPRPLWEIDRIGPEIIYRCMPILYSLKIPLLVCGELSPGNTRRPPR